MLSAATFLKPLSLKVSSLTHDPSRRGFRPHAQTAPGTVHGRRLRAQGDAAMEERGPADGELALGLLLMQFLLKDSLHPEQCGTHPCGSTAAFLTACVA